MINSHLTFAEGRNMHLPRNYKDPSFWGSFYFRSQILENHFNWTIILTEDKKNYFIENSKGNRIGGKFQ